MRSSLLKIWLTFRYGFVALVMALIVGFTNSRLADRRINDVAISVDNQFENYFIDQEDVLGLINEEGKDYLLNNSLGSLNLKELESRIENHQFVKKAEAFVDLEGNLSINVEQNRPIARVLNPDGRDVYIGTAGDILPESDHYTARVILIQLEDMSWLPEYSLLDARGGEEFFAMIQKIVKDKFWSAQIAGIYVKDNMEIYLMPQVTKQVVEFGEANQVEMKLKKLRSFYKQILPYKGWNAYDTVNLKYENQIVCKK